MNRFSGSTTGVPYPSVTQGESEEVAKQPKLSTIKKADNPLSFASKGAWSSGKILDSKSKDGGSIPSAPADETVDFYESG